MSQSKWSYNAYLSKREIWRKNGRVLKKVSVSKAQIISRKFSRLRTVIFGQFETHLSCSSTNGTFSACVFVWNSEQTIRYTIIHIFMMKFMKPL